MYIRTYIHRLPIQAGLRLGDVIFGVNFIPTREGSRTLIKVLQRESKEYKKQPPNNKDLANNGKVGEKKPVTRNIGRRKYLYLQAWRWYTNIYLCMYCIYMYYTYVCMYVCIYCIYVCIYCIYVFIYCMYAFMYVYTVCMYVCTVYKQYMYSIHI